MTDLVTLPAPGTQTPLATLKAVDAETVIAQRDRGLDTLRGLATGGVVLGHWFVTAYAVVDGVVHYDSPLVPLPGLAGLSWVCQLLGLFFLVGGRTSAASLDQLGPGAYAAWLRSRTARLVAPVLAMLAATTVGMLLLLAVGAPAASVRVVATLAVQPLWFVGVYLVATALTPLLVRAVTRLGLVAPLVAVLWVAGVDVWRFGPGAASMPDAIAWSTILPGGSSATSSGSPGTRACSRDGRATHSSAEGSPPASPSPPWRATR